MNSTAAKHFGAACYRLDNYVIRDLNDMVDLDRTGYFAKLANAYDAATKGTHREHFIDGYASVMLAR